MAEYIEREAALNIVNGWREQLIPTYGKNDEYVKCLETVAEHLEALHAADVRPVVRGKWIQDCDYHFRCSACGDRWAVSNGHPLDVANGWNYCPNCGADMRGNDDEI